MTDSEGKVVRRQSLISKSIEEKKEHLYAKQAADYAFWIAELLGIDPLEPDLITALRSGTVLLLVIKKIFPEKLKDITPPSLSKQVNVFQAAESVKKFLQCCERVGIKHEDLFQPNDLIELQNKLKVLRTLQCLRKLQETALNIDAKAHPIINPEDSIIQSQNTTINNNNNINPSTETKITPAINPDKSRDQNIVNANNPFPAETGSIPVEGLSLEGDGEGFSSRRNSMKVKVNELTRIRSMRLFTDNTNAFSAHWEGEGLKPIYDGEEPRSIESAFPKEKGVVEVPILDDDGKDEEGEEGFIEPMDPNIMAHLLSRVSFGTDDNDEEGEEEEGEEGEQGEKGPEAGIEEVDSDLDENDLQFDEEEKDEQQQELIEELKSDLEELQELLKTEIVAHMKETELLQDQHKFVQQRLAETDRRAIEAEHRARESEEQVKQLLILLEERDQSIALLSNLYNDQLKKAAEAIEQATIAEGKANALLLLTQPPAPDAGTVLVNSPSLIDFQKEMAEDQANKKKKKKKKKNNNNSKPKEEEEVGRQRRKSYVPRKPKHKPLAPTLSQLPELEQEAGIKTDPKDRKKSLENLSIKSKEEEEEGDEDEEDDEEEETMELSHGDHSSASLLTLGLETFPELPKKIGPGSYIPCINVERANSVHKNNTQLWSHLEQVKPSLSQISERERARQETIFEFIMTEEAYVSDLELIIRVFMVPLFDLIGKHGFIKADYDLIFRNIENITRANVGFYKDLKNRQSQNPLVSGIGDIILKHVIHFEGYADYCGDQKRATAELKKLMNENTEIRKFFDTCQQNPECRKLDVFAFLLLPMQRLTKYPLLLKNLMKTTKEGEQEYECIKAAMMEVRRLITTVDQYAYRKDELNRINEIEKCLNWNLASAPVSLADSEEVGRYLVKEGPLTRLRLKTASLASERKPSRKMEILYCFFFNDMFIFTKQINSPELSSPKYIVQFAPLTSDTYSVRNVPEATNGLGAKNVFLISSKASGTIVLHASSEEEKEKWISCFRKEDKIVEMALSVEEQGQIRKVDPNYRHSAGDLITSPKTEVPGLYRHSSAPMLNSNEIMEPEFNLRKSFSTNQLKENSNVTIEELTEPEFDGWLKILTRGAFQTTSWKLRWCVLKDFIFYYFPDDHVESKALGTLVLPSHRVVAGKTVKKESSKKNIFKIEHPSGLTKPLVCCADTVEYFDVWVQALTHATMSRIAKRNFWL